MVALFLLLTLTYCWSRYEVQNMNYATAVGIDYVDDQYTLYVQLLDFSTVAKLEGQQKAEQPLGLGGQRRRFLVYGGGK
nr:hypothetical protein P5640_19930 [Bacillus subtilis]